MWALSQPFFCALGVVELRVDCVRDGWGHIVVNTCQAGSTVAKDSQGQWVSFVLEVIAQAVGLGAQAVDADGSVGTRAFSCRHVVRGVSLTWRR